MRIVAGRWAGVELVSPGGRVRPTSEAVRVAALEWVAGALEGAAFLDLCAGTGAVGLEALSRGAARADFVERAPAAFHSLKANVAALGVRDRTRIFKKGVHDFLGSPRMERWDVAFADPPYPSRLAEEIAARWLGEPFSRTLLVEHDPERSLPEGGPGVRVRRRVLGDAGLTRYEARKGRPRRTRAGRRGPRPPGRRRA